MNDSQIRNLLNCRIKDHICVMELILNDDDLRSKICSVAEMVLSSLKSGGSLFLCGNGGSAADAQHIATEFVSKFYKERRAYHAEALTANTSSLTAIGNDYGFDDVFARQVEAKAHKGDVLIGISTSGTSRNVCKAIEVASQMNIKSVLLTGNRDNKYDPATYDYVICIPSDDTPRIQEAHIFVGHLLAEYVESVLSLEDE